MKTMSALTMQAAAVISATTAGMQYANGNTLGAAITAAAAICMAVAALGHAFHAGKDYPR